MAENYPTRNRTSDHGILVTRHLPSQTLGAKQNASSAHTPHRECGQTPSPKRMTKRHTPQGEWQLGERDNRSICRSSLEPRASPRDRRRHRTIGAWKRQENQNSNDHDVGDTLAATATACMPCCTSQPIHQLSTIHHLETLPSTKETI